MLGGAVLRQGLHLRTRKLHACILGDGCSNGAVALHDTLAVIALFEIGEHVFILDAAGKAVREHALQAIANLYARASVADSDNNEGTVIFFLGAYAPFA